MKKILVPLTLPCESHAARASAAPFAQACNAPFERPHFTALQPRQIHPSQ
jgi:hypothetical protein